MKTIVIILSSVLLASTVEEDRLEIVTLLHVANIKFSIKFFQEVVKTQSDPRLVMSAHSVLTPLAQLSLVSKGESQEELLHILGLPDTNAVIQAFKIVSKYIHSVQGVTLKTVNRIYVGLQAKVDNKVNALSKDIFNAEFKNMNFEDSTAAANDINLWVESQTDNRVSHIVRASSIFGGTSALLINAVYFKGKWAIPFDEKNTELREFYVNKDKKAYIQMMSQRNRYLYGYSIELKAQILEIPYENHEASFVAILPREIDGISELQEKILDLNILNATDNDLNVNDVKVYLPKFKIATIINLTDVLKHIGVTKIFSADNISAKLTKLIDSGEPLHISNAIQKVLIEIDEEGAEATLKNGFLVASTASANESEPLLEFNANHAFVFAIKVHDEVLFTGVFRQ